MAKGTGLIFHFPMLLQPERRFLAYRSTYLQGILLGLTSVLLSSLLAVKSVDLMVACDGFLCIMEIIGIFHSGHFDYRGAFQVILDLYCSFMIG